MQISLNNKPHSISEGASLHDLVSAQLGEKTNGVAVAINSVVVPKQSWCTTKVNPNDQILIIKATQGG